MSHKAFCCLLLHVSSSSSSSSFVVTQLSSLNNVAFSFFHPSPPPSHHSWLLHSVLPSLSPYNSYTLTLSIPSYLPLSCFLPSSSFSTLFCHQSWYSRSFNIYVSFFVRADFLSFLCICSASSTFSLSLSSSYSLSSPSFSPSISHSYYMSCFLLPHSSVILPFYRNLPISIINSCTLYPSFRSSSFYTFAFFQYFCSSLFTSLQPSPFTHLPLPLFSLCQILPRGHGSLAFTHRKPF